MKKQRIAALEKVVDDNFDDGYPSPNEVVNAIKKHDPDRVYEEYSAAWMMGTRTKSLERRYCQVFRNAMKAEFSEEMAARLILENEGEE